MKVSELNETALDWAVAVCENLIDADAPLIFFEGNYCTNWALAGEIIEREGVSIVKIGRSVDDAIAPHPDCWCAHIDGAYATYEETPLIAAMRSYVAMKLGNEIEVPEEIM